MHADVCVVGAGAAGIPLALSLTGKGLKVLLLEAGERSQDSRAQAHYQGEVADERMHSPLHRYRLRGLGGSTSLWGGRCMPYDPIDFEERAWVPHSGWPISYEGLLPYYARANAWAEAGRFSYDARHALPGAPPLFAGFDSSIVRTDGLERFSCPTDFGAPLPPPHGGRARPARADRRALHRRAPGCRAATRCAPSTWRRSRATASR